MSPDFDGPESHFAISFAQKSPTIEEVEATVSALVGASVRSQLLKLHIADRDASLDQLMLRTGIRRTRLTGDRCPALKARVDALDRVVIDTHRPNILALMHAPVHQIVISRIGASISAVLQDPGTPLVRWSVDTFDALKKCAGV